MGTNVNKETLKIYYIAPFQPVQRKSAFIFVPGLVEGLTKDMVAECFGESKKSSPFIILGKTAPEILTMTTLKKARNEGTIQWVSYEDNKPYYISKKDKTKIYIVGDDVPDTTAFTFRINPTHIKVNKSKLFTKLRTRGGFEFQHWGPDITEITLDGTTGNLSPTWVGTKFKTVLGVSVPIPKDLYNPDISSGAPTEDNSDAMAAFRELDRLINNDQNETMVKNGSRFALSYRGQIFVGHIATFSYDEKGDQPFQIYYTMQFLVHYEASSLEVAENFVQENIQRNAETIDRLRQIKGEPTTPGFID